MDFKTSLILIVLYCCDVIEALSRRPRLSDACNPMCGPYQFCLEFPSINGPNLLTCVDDDELPNDLRQYDEGNAIPRIPPNPGCPAPSLVQASPSCVNQCLSHGDCGRGLLCCYNGCGQVCVADMRVQRSRKLGSCPRQSRRPASRNRVCSDECRSDYQCPGIQKCCGSECNRKCEMPCFHWTGTSSSLWGVANQCQGRSSSSTRSRRQRYRRTDTQTDSQTDSQTHTQTGSQTDTQANGQRYTQRYRHRSSSMAKRRRADNEITY